MTVAVTTQIGEIIPAINTRRVHIVEDKSYRVIADWMHLENDDVPLAWYRLALVRRMALDLSAGTLYPQIFGRKVESLSIIEGD